MLRPGDHLALMAGGEAEVIAVRFTNERAPVYNLTIPETPTYFVGEGGVWVHNCSLKVKGFNRVWNNKHGPHLQDQLRRKAISTGKPQGVFTGNQQEIEMFIRSKLPLNNGAKTFVAPGTFGKVFLPDGSSVPTNLIRITPSGTGIKTAYPVPLFFSP